MTEFDNLTLGQIVRSAREKHRKTQRELAAELSCAKTTIARIEANSIRRPKLPMLERISQVLEIPLTELQNAIRTGPKMRSTPQHSQSRSSSPLEISDPTRQDLYAELRKIARLGSTAEQLDALSQLPYVVVKALLDIMPALHQIEAQLTPRQLPVVNLDDDAPTSR